MLTERNQAEMLALFIISEMPEELTVAQAEGVLLASGELSQLSIGEYLDSLAKRDNIYIAKASEDEFGDRIGITELGEQVVETFAEKKALFRASINKALRMYRKLTTGVEFRIDLSQAEGGGSYVVFERYLNGKLSFSTTVFFEKSHDALEAYNRMDDNPDSFFNGFLTVATGNIDYLM